MNEVFAIVKIIDYKYSFSIKKKQNAICNIVAILKNKSIINLIAYNEMADKCLKIMKKENLYYIEGMINSNIDIIIKDFYS